MTQVARWGGLALAALVALGGCDGSGGAPPASASTAEAKVKGTVTRKGKPLAKVQVMFNPANINRKSAPSVTATAGDDGVYEITTLAGENSVSLVGPVAAKDPTLTYFGRSVDLKAGENTLDLDIP